MSYDKKRYRCYNEMVPRVVVHRKVKEKVAYTHTKGKKKYFIVKHITRASTDTRERERELSLIHI